MKLKKIDKDNLPKCEVLATDQINYVAGLLKYDSDWEIVICESGKSHISVENVTHYIELHNIEMED